MADKINVRQIRSAAGYNRKVLETLKGLGLGRIGKEKELPMNPSVLGTVKAVQYLVEVRKVK